MDAEMENKTLQAIEGLNKKVDSLSDQAETLVNKFNKLSDELLEQNQILKRLLLLAEASADVHSKMILELEEINSELKPKPQPKPYPKHDGIGMNDQKLMAFISNRAREAKYDPDQIVIPSCKPLRRG